MDDVQFPPSIIQSLLVRTVHLPTIGMAILLLGMVPVGASAAPSQLACTPSNLRFGAIVVGQSETLLVTVANTGQTSTTLSGITVNKSAFTTSALSLPLVLLAGQSVQVSVTFTPAAIGWTGGKITFSSNASNATLLEVRGTGESSEPLTTSPSTVSFGQVAIGATSTVPVVLTNARSWKVTLSALQTTGDGFSMSGPIFPLTLGAGQSVTVNVAFAPQSAGTTGGSLFVFGPALAIPLMGTGTATGQLTIAPAPLNFGNVLVGTTGTQQITLSAVGGSVTVSSAAISNSQFALNGVSFPFTIGAGQGVSFKLAFTPQSSGAATGSLSFLSNAPQAADSAPHSSIPLSGTGVMQGALRASPTSLAFGSVQVGNSVSLFQTLTNTGGSTVAISQANITGEGFSISGLNLPLNLTANQSVTFTATYTPTSAGPASGILPVVSNASNSALNIALTATGTAPGQLALSTTNLSFGNVAVGSNSSLNGTLTASGVPVTITSANLNNSEFVLSGISLPATLAAGQSVAFTVAFTPQASGATSGSLAFSSNASNSPAVLAMTGMGMAPIQHNVDLTWIASTNAVGYNIYRSAAANGSYSMINSSLDSTAAYTDTTVVSGQTYYYVATALNSAGQESAYSAPVQAVVP